MATALQRQRPASRGRTARDTVQWNDTAAMAQRQMQVLGLESLTVVDGSRAIGRVARRDIERCENRGNWLGAVMVIDLVQDDRDTCN